ncbi:MAG: ribonuclease H-like domain-containing protein [Synergistales bacterium]|nr:ribonuclease H-like domain-containing protein [Synergistales bacterium]
MGTTRKRLRRMLGEPAAAPHAPEAPAPHNLPTGEWLDEGVYGMEQSIPATAFPYHKEREPLLGPWGEALPPLFIDLETTGLAGGTGTYAFLAGIGFFREDRLVVRQLFLATPAAESRWLSRILQSLPTETAGLVTYNGKRFDIPLLETRHILTGVGSPWYGMGHLDLLHMVRRLWKKELDSCSLGNVERHILGFLRSGEDVPGWEVPQRYHHFLETGDAAPLEGVFYHNREDILSLARIRSRIAALMEGDATSAEHLSAGDAWASRGETERARHHWELAIPRGEAHWRLGMAAKGNGTWEQAEGHFREARRQGERYLDCCEELAKIYEHRLKDIDRALAETEGALRHLRNRRAVLGPSWKRRREAFEHRSRRLQGKMGSNRTPLAQPD